MTAISYQLYGSRNWPLADTLSMLAEAGYKHVEGYGALFAQAPSLAEDLRAAGLSMPTLHYGLDDLERDPQAAVDLGRAVGAEAIFAPMLQAPDRPVDPAGWQAFAARLVAAGRPLQEAGFVFGWHNHDFELIDLGDGVMPLDIIAGAAPELKLELDLGWTARAGHDPVAMVERFAGQIHAAHIKDVAPAGACTDEDGWADVGHGMVTWAPVHAALQKAGVRRYVIEHDNPSDHRRCARRSLATVQAF
ncbi:sugar phosphate isomerase/epimerase family protein [Phaeobacter inhibens]|uniref:sugar phosphate isomerase/epimerase family protein n=1 Tax=Phaeobacter inhibens TaxID=221822 RepID=UPI000C9CBDDF|nr:sugar phosphate isomerase/epimerase [Phaeobacter inhibens]AUQ64786.1 Xylose isomerase-like TIM barrel [Phaeobacter inhibens]AUQ84624.1 Xylose isomerase-like TIM barrel [Phaeobacter inhibens]AUQ92704.1 Xylose isomerase-like TIM barrel [Phaeobacter inhibens]MDO6757956.1 sugar phosphate isomerase/epimerase [Phaeobacter inhibens]